MRVAFGKTTSKAQTVAARAVLTNERWSGALRGGANESFVHPGGGQGVAVPAVVLELRDPFIKQHPQGGPQRNLHQGGMQQFGSSAVAARACPLFFLIPPQPPQAVAGLMGNHSEGSCCARGGGSWELSQEEEEVKVGGEQEHGTGETWKREFEPLELCHQQGKLCTVWRTVGLDVRRTISLCALALPVPYGIHIR